MTKTETMRSLGQAARLIDEVQRWSRDTSRYDNGSLLEIARYLRQVKSRVRTNYDRITAEGYTRMWWERPLLPRPASSATREES